MKRESSALHGVPPVEGPRLPTRWMEIARRNVESHRDQFEALADPFKVIQVNPHDVRYRCLMHVNTERERGSKFYDWGKVISGDWDVAWNGDRIPEFKRGTAYRAVYDRYVRSLSWAETGVIDAMMTVIDERGEEDGCRTRSDVVERYERLDVVFEDIKTRGFRLMDVTPEGSFPNLFVSIGRNGGFLLAKPGNHRLAIAMVLELGTIPVYVMSRHEGWQRRRERIARDAPDVGMCHPDLAEFQR